MKLAVIALFAFAFATSSHSPTGNAEQGLSSRYTRLGGCKYLADGEKLGQDWVVNRCSGLGNIPIWLGYTDSVRSHLGFGPRENLSGPFSAVERDKDWRVEWRGVGQGRKFVPFAVIVRMQRPDAGVADDEKGLLFVYRLRPDGTSCLVGSDLTSNKAAQDVADSARVTYKCQFEPDLPDM